MKKVFHKLDITEDKDDDFGAIVMPQETHRCIDGKWKRTPFLGYVLFTKSQRDSDTVMHECVHMAVAYLRRTKRKSLALAWDRDDREEDLCYTAGTCADQVIRQFYRNGVYEE